MPSPKRHLDAGLQALILYTILANFTVATKCRDAVQSMLRQLEKDETDPNNVFETLEQTKEFLYGWICNHCPSSLGPMHYEDMVSFPESRRLSLTQRV